MKFDYLREFLVVAETLNFTIAARQLFITQSALSRHIALLEDYLGARLFQRNTHSVKLTLFGETACAEAKRMVAITDNLITKASLMKKGTSGVIRLGIPSYSTSYFDPIFHEFRSRFPDISLEIVSSQPTKAYQALIEGSIDIALLYHHAYPAEERLVFLDFAIEPLVLVSLKDHPLATASHVSLEDLNGQTIVQLKNNHLSEFTGSILERNRIKTQGVVYSDSIDTLPYSLVESNGVAIEPLSVSNMSRSGLAYTFFTDDEMEVPVSMVHLSDANNHAISPFLKVVSEQVC